MFNLYIFLIYYTYVRGIIIGPEIAIIENILTIILSAVVLFIAIKISNSGIVKKYDVNVSTLEKVTKNLIIIAIIICVLSLVLQVILIPISVHSNLEEAQELYELLGATEKDLELLKQEAEKEMPKIYITTIVMALASLIIEVVGMKYAVYDLEKKVTNKV